MDDVRYQKMSLAQRQILLKMALYNAEVAPVYSGDIALALQLPHRLVKDRIEVCYPALCSTCGGDLWPERHKRTKIERQMRGYMIPLPAVLRVLLPYKPWASFAVWEWNVILHTCYGSGSYCDTLN